MGSQPIIALDLGKFKTVEALIKRTNRENPSQADRDELRVELRRARRAELLLAR